MKTTVFLGIVLMSCMTLSAQVMATPKDSLEINLDVVSRYIWRGQSWGGNYVAVQPAVNYTVNDTWTFGFWATTNFKKDYFYPDGVAGKGYQEIDLSVNYAVTDYMEIQLCDYYWPSVERVEGVDNGYFNYGKNSVKTIDASLLFDFDDAFEIPLKLTLSTLVAGNDYRYDSNGENPKQNYTTYFEAGYSWKKLFQKITFELVGGAVLNNQAQYYTSGDYNKVSVVNLSLKATRKFKLANRFTMPLTLNYIHNAATENTDYFGKDFLIFGLTFNYK